MMMMGNAQIRTHTHFPSGRPRTHNLAQRAKRENRSKSIGRRRRLRAWKHGDQTRSAFETSFASLYDYSTLLGRARAHTQLAAIVTRDESRGSTVESDFGETTPRESEHYFDYTAFFLLFLGATLDSPFFFPFVSFLIFCTRLLLNLLLLFLNSPGSSRTAMG